MYKKTILLGVCAIFAGTLVLSACTAQSTPQSPTLDANAIYTQAAATVSAGLALTEGAKPTSTVTPIPPATNTPTSINGTATVAQPGPQDTPAVTATQSSALTPLPSFTSAVVVPTTNTSGDKAEWVANTPADKSKFTKGAYFDVSFTIKNTGTTTWTTDYTIRFFAGEQMGVRPAINFPITPVKPGETVVIPLGQLQAPQTAGNYMIWWKLTNAEGKNFYDVSLELEITN
jgi:hypothetical protein